METYKYSYDLKQPLPSGSEIKVGVAGSGNLEIVLGVNCDAKKTEVTVHTVVTGYKNTWDAVIERFIADYPYAGLFFTLNDAGATPSVVSLRLRQAIETYQTGYRVNDNYIESSARTRVISLVDECSFQEFLTGENCASPNLPALNMQIESDDGVVIGRATIHGKAIAVAAQQRDFIGGSVGEVHGAKINGLIKYAIKNNLEAFVFLIDSGGVRLQEANVGEIEISEIIRSLLEAKSAGVKTIAVVCGNNGAYGGVGIIAGVMDYIIVNQVARIGVSGADVIQAVKGAEVFDSSDRPLIWRVYGGRTRYLQKAAQGYTTQMIKDIKNAIDVALSSLNPKELITQEILVEEQQELYKRIQDAKGCEEEGDWLQQNKLNLFQQNPFTVSDREFIALVSEGEQNAK